MLLYPLECAGLLMRSRREWLKGLGTEVTGSLGKEEASAGSRQNTVLGCGHGREADMYGCTLKQEAFLGLGTGATENSHQREQQSEPAVPWCASAPPSREGRAALLTRLIRHPFSHAWETRKTLLRLLLWANTASHPTPQDQYLERSQLLTCFWAKLHQNYKSMHTAGTRERSSQWTLRYSWSHQYPFILQSKVCARRKETRLFPRPRYHLPFSVGDCQHFHKISKAQQHFSYSPSTIQRNLPL